MLVAILVIAFLLWLVNRTSKPKNFPPGPPRLPVIGSAPFMGGSGPVKSIIHGISEQAAKHGPLLGFYMGNTPMVVATDFNLIKELYKNDNITARPDFKPMDEARPGYDIMEGKCPGIICASGKSWKEVRRFVLRHLRDFGFGKSSMEERFHNEVTEFCQLLAAREGEPVSLQGSLNVSIVNSLWSIVVGERLHPEDPHLIEMADLINAFLKIVSPSGASFLCQLLPCTSLAKLPVLRHLTGFQTSVDIFKQTTDLFEPYIDQHEKTFDPNRIRDFLDVMLLECKTNTNPDSVFNDKIGRITIISSLFDLFTAGMETLSTSIQMTVLQMLHHPEVQERLHQEIDEVVGKDRLPSLTDRPSMHYVNAVLQESMRVASIVYMGVPHSASEDIKVGSYVIPKDTIVCGSIYHVHHNPDFFENPKVFNPDRFIDENGHFIADDRVIPFSVGKRYCIGKSLAEKEFFIFFACLLQKFDFKAVPGTTLPSYIDIYPDGATIRAAPAYQVLLEKRIACCNNNYRA